MSDQWTDVCGAEDVETEDVIGVEVDGRPLAVYRSPDDDYFITDGLCTHEKVKLADGLVMDYVIECPKHNGRFDYRSGAGKGAPICENLRTYDVRVEGGRVLVRLAE
jgi:3-phenylpropionate/trans-cinnamate dioxygenase ferredoxin component